jgi:chlorite dismutase
MNHSADPKIDIRERGARGQSLDRRLFLQLQAFGNCTDATPVIRVLEQSSHDLVLYQDLNDPKGIAVLGMSENPAYFVTDWRELLNSPPLSGLAPKPELTMLGRTYASGFEPDLEHWLLRKPRATVLNPDWPWAIWYPLRRSGAFAGLDPKEQGAILREHATIGRAYGEADLAHDVRLACHGLDKNDNDFVIGLIGRNLHPLSHIVQTMRKTRQTSQYIESLGPFFIGGTLWQSPLPPAE